MYRPRVMTIVILLNILVSIACTESARADGFLKSLKDAATAGINPKVRGRVQLSDGRTLSCFVGIKSGYIGPPDMTGPSYNVTDPASGRVSVRTGAIPTMIMLPPATVRPNDCDSLAADNLLIADANNPAAGVAAVSKLPPKTPCRQVPPEAHAQYPACVSFDPDDHCSALPVDGTWLNGQTDLAAVCDSRKANAMIAEEDAYQRKKAAQAVASKPPVDPTPTSVPMTAATSQVEEAAKLCSLKPALAEGLRDQAIQFVRFDKAKDRVVMSEVIQGRRQEVTWDEKTFGQRTLAASADLSGGGIKCGVAYWDGQAIKAATAALSN